MKYQKHQNMWAAIASPTSLFVGKQMIFATRNSLSWSTSFYHGITSLPFSKCRICSVNISQFVSWLRCTSQPRPWDHRT